MGTFARSAASTVGFVLLGSLLAPATRAATAEPKSIAVSRVSVHTYGAQANGRSTAFGMSSDGRYTAFVSHASNLVPGDTNGIPDVFVHDGVRRIITRVSVSTEETQARGGDPAVVTSVAISGLGRFVAFTSEARNLVPGDDNEAMDAFVHDRVRGTTTRVSQGALTEPHYATTGVSISSNGRYVGFTSQATSIVPGDTNQATDAFAHDQWTGKTVRVSVGTAQAQAGEGGSMIGRFSGNGRYVLFHSWANNLTPGDVNDQPDLFLRDLVARTTTRISTGNGVSSSLDWIGAMAAISAEGRHVAYSSDDPDVVAGDTNGNHDVFLYDRSTRATTRISRAPRGGQADGGGSYLAAISPNGRFVSYSSFAGNLVPGDTGRKLDAFRFDRRTSSTTRMSTAVSGVQGNGRSEAGDISADGRRMVVGSEATNLVLGDTNGVMDIFVISRP